MWTVEITTLNVCRLKGNHIYTTTLSKNMPDLCQIVTQKHDVIWANLRHIPQVHLGIKCPLHCLSQIVLVTILSYEMQ